MAEPRPRASWYAGVGCAVLALGVAAVAAHHLLGASTAWITRFDAAASVALVALALAAVPATLARAVPPRIAIAVAVLGANVAFIVATLAGRTLVRFPLYPSSRFAVVLAIATTAGAVGLVRRRMWARWLYLALGAGAIGCGALNLLNFWSVSGHVDPSATAWSMQVIEQAWGYAITIVAGLLLVGTLAPIGDAFVAGPSHATWTSDAAVMRTLRLSTIATLAAVPMLLVYAWMQPVAPATRTPALVLAALLTVGVIAAVRGHLIGALVQCLGGLGLAAQTVATWRLAPAAAAHVPLYYAVFWMPAALLAVAAAAQLAGPVARLLRR